VVPEGHADQDRCVRACRIEAANQLLQHAA
jgi:hypothetical protein